MDRFLALQMVRNDLGHEHGDLVRGVKLACLFPGISGEHAYEIFVDEAEHIVALPAIHGDVLDELNQLADGLGLLCGGVAKFAQAGFKRLKNALEETLVVRVYKATEGRQRIAHMGYIEVSFVLDPCRKQMLVGNEVADVAFNVFNGLSVVL